MGYSFVSKAYKVYQPQTRKMIISRYVHFNEDEQWDYKKDPKWKKAMEDEMSMIQKNKTWELVVKPKDRKVIGVKWVYKTKLNVDGSINKYKARLVVKGYALIFGVDYCDTFVPVARLDTVRLLLAIATQKGWKVF